MGSDPERDPGTELVDMRASSERKVSGADATSRDALRRDLRDLGNKGFQAASTDGLDGLHALPPIQEAANDGHARRDAALRSLLEAAVARLGEDPLAAVAPGYYGLNRRGEPHSTRLERAATAYGLLRRNAPYSVETFRTSHRPTLEKRLGAAIAALIEEGWTAAASGPNHGSLAAPGNSEGKVVLPDRASYAEAFVNLLNRDPRQFRGTWVGPLFLHPDWYFARRNADTPRPNPDSALRAYLLERARDRTHGVKLLLRNTARYRVKVDEYVRASERPEFIKDVLDLVDDLWGSDGSRGPDLCCADTGYLKVEVLIDETMIVSHRTSSRSPLSGGTLVTDALEVAEETRRFDAVFADTSRGQVHELDSLRRFVEHLWSD